MKHAQMQNIPEKSRKSKSSWEPAFQKTLPKIFEILSSIIFGKNHSRVHVLPAGIIPANVLPQTLYLNDANHKK
jgi:hypothetical protein